MQYEYPLSDPQIEMLAEFTLGAVAASGGYETGLVPETVPLPGVHATIEGRVSNWEGLDDNEYQVLCDEILAEAERRS